MKKAKMVLHPKRTEIIVLSTGRRLRNIPYHYEVYDDATERSLREKGFPVRRAD